MNFRRWITAMAVLALFVGLASAQVSTPGTGSGPLQCTANVAVPAQLRAEGLSDLIGDITLNCTGGTALAAGAAIPTFNITVALQTNITSKLLGSSSASEALLLIDEPGSPAGSALVALPGYGPAAPQTGCSSLSVGAGPGGCTQVAGVVSNTPVAQATGGGQAANVFQGTYNSAIPNQITFYGVPILPPVSAGTSRVFRITNIRANISGLGVTGTQGTTPMLASISTTALSVSNPVLTAGFIQTGLATALRAIDNSGGLTVPNYGQCTQTDTGSYVPVAVLRYRENFATAFKTRVAPTSAANSGQSGAPAASVPGTVYNTESGFITSAVSNAGLADFGTRVKAVMTGIPSGVHIFVSTNNLTSSGVTSAATAPAGGIGSSDTSAWAQLVSGESITDANGIVPALSNTTTTNSVKITEIPVVNGQAVAAWEVLNTNTSAIDTLYFGVWQSFAFAPGTSSTAAGPAAGAVQIVMSYAPTPSTGGFAVADAVKASQTIPSPRFADPSGSPSALFNIVLCQTTLLFPYMTNASGFDTGFAIANTTMDPFGTSQQAGTCSLNFYGTNPPDSTKVPAPFDGKTSIASGATAAAVLSGIATDATKPFTGYMIAVCNFQLAHGFAFISDPGVRNFAMGYLALIVPTGVSKRNAITEALDN